MIKSLRNYLINDEQLMILLDNKPAIYLLQKPKELDNDNYIIYLYKPLSGGKVKDYQVEFRIVGNDLSKLIAIQSRIVKILDENYNIDEIYMSKLLNGGGMIYNPDTGNYEMVVFFLCKI